ncbi:FkbM family methyltransferase [Pseudonocardiaceae bacterium YIM PH 21723]|nr:FkbM family methyltransferase [Pseudonocardiaceae bacterium YIM PH 21723]
MPETLACTIVARNYLPAAKVLARSYLAQHPDHEVVVLVLDGVGAAASDSSGQPARVRFVGPETAGLDRDEFLRMATAYNITELATAVKPYLLRELRRTAEVAIYLDPDIEVYAPMPELSELAKQHSIVLTPHFLQPLPRDGRLPAETDVMGSGIFNLGFIAVGPGSEGFLDFWAERLRHDAIVAPDRQLFTDQRWVDQVPALFPNHVLRDPGFNVAYWNAHERPVDRAADGTPTAGGRPLRFYHFSGYRPERPWQLSVHSARNPRVVLSDHPVLAELCHAYGEQLKAGGYDRALDDVPYGFAKAADGSALPSAVRRLYRDEWIKAEKKDKPLPPHAFGPDAADFRAFLTAPGEPTEAGAGLNRYVMLVWRSRPDLQTAFPQPCGRDAADFKAWCRTSGIREKQLPDWALPEDQSFEEPHPEFGVNVLGYLTAELGVGEMGRIVHDAIAAAGIPVASVVEDKMVYNRTALQGPSTQGSPRFPLSLLAVNADQTQVVLEHHPEVGHHRYRIGLWAWELEDFPKAMHPAFDLVDEVWTVSEFCAKAMSEHATVPVKAIPVPVRDPGPVQLRERTADDPVRFLFAFDFNSIGQRKNPWGVVEAFQRAFPDRDNASLLIKAINGKKNTDAAERLRLAAAGDPRITLIEHYLSVADLNALYTESDAYVSLHRSEGFGLTVAEAMVRGMPVISTDYSSTTEFLSADTGWPVPYELIEVGIGHPPYPADAVWADPDLDAAAAAMREIAGDPAEARRRGQAARAHLLSTRGMDQAARWMREQLEQAHQTWLRGGEIPMPETDPMEPLRNAREALRWRAEADADAKNPFAPALRKAVLRAVDHYDVHQRRVLAALMDGVEGTVGEVTGRLTARIAELEARLDSGLSAATSVSTETGVQLAELRGELEAAGVREQSLRADVDAAHAEAIGALERVDDTGQLMLDMFGERDVRLDQVEGVAAQNASDLRATERALAARHAPVPPGTRVVVCDAGVLLVPQDDVVAPWLAYHRSWEVEEAELMAQLVGTGTFLDIGAHVGYHSLRLLNHTHGPSRVVAIEANPETAELLQRNVIANLSAATAERVSVLAVAAWDEPGIVHLHQVEAGNSGDHRVSADGAGVEVPAVRLAEQPEVSKDRVSLIKVDLQGRDHRALRGLTEIIERDQPNVVLEYCPEAIEELGDNPAQVLADYRRYGYRIRVVGDPAEYTDTELVAKARAAESGFVTLWLYP